ncbi:MAG: chemotaxis protein CheA [Desulfobacteraceae bacterium]|nr:chemotaxis protein CheA [Desulfobacteraceae bacterium]
MCELKQVCRGIDDLSLLIGEYCPGDEPGEEGIIHAVDTLIDNAGSIHEPTFLTVARACRSYGETMVHDSLVTIRPLEEAVALLKALVRHEKNGKEFGFDISDILEGLIPKTDIPELVPKVEAVIPEVCDDPGDGIPSAVEAPLSDEDAQIIMEFVAESEEGLASIEIGVVELEQAPSDMEIINNIFRPFHTIKGVSGFLGLKKINTLAHATETFLDSARSGEFLINDSAIDVILEAVDTLKLLLSRVREATARGVTQKDDGIEIHGLGEKLQALQVSLARGERQPIGEILVDKGIIDQDALESALEIQQRNPGEKLGEILVSEKKAGAREVASALMEQKTAGRVSSDSQVKVNTAKLDELVNLAGELVISQSMLRQQAGLDSRLQQGMGQMGQIVSSIQNIAMSMRMVPIKATFMKMIRLVRDLSRKSGKKVGLVMIGEDTEIDRNVVEALYEPLVHMIRNSVDHGIETCEERARQGKPAQGTIFLRAFHKGGNIHIEIEDDGKGLDRDGILAKAVSTGLISGDENLSDAQIHDLIFQPGFSTAKAVTDVSGRGVGMDVVNEGIEKLRGHLSITSTPGRGTKFNIVLPLTLAIIDGMLVRVGEERYVIPTMVIQRSFRPDRKECFSVEGKEEMIRDRDGLIPLIRMDGIFGVSTDCTDPWEGLVVVVECKDRRLGILIDELLGKDEYVIKSLGQGLDKVIGFSGGAILADGRVGMILDIHGISSLVAG